MLLAPASPAESQRGLGTEVLFMPLKSLFHNLINTKNLQNKLWIQTLASKKKEFIEYMVAVDLIWLQGQPAAEADCPVWPHNNV